jgi:adenine/guanine phosphoribosyltransferase-like PRPP-binding protein
MIKRYVAQNLVQKLSETTSHRLNMKETLVLGVVLKGLPVAYSLARINAVVENLVPVVAHRPLYMQHYVESYFPSPEWETYFRERLNHCENLLIVDDIVNTGFTKQKLESIVYPLTKDAGIQSQFAALILNRKNLVNQSFVGSDDIFTLRVDATEVECDWGLITVPLWGLPVKEALLQCEEYFQRFWLNEKRFINIIY